MRMLSFFYSKAAPEFSRDRAPTSSLALFIDLLVSSAEPSSSMLLISLKTSSSCTGFNGTMDTLPVDLLRDFGASTFSSRRSSMSSSSSSSNYGSYSSIPSSSSLSSSRAASLAMSAIVVGLTELVLFWEDDELPLLTGCLSLGRDLGRF